jgi:hypothetical protein
VNIGSYARTLFAAAAALFAVAGCVDYEAAVDLRADGSGRLVVHYSSKDYFTIFDSDWSWEHGKEKRVPPEDLAEYEYRFTKPGQRVIDVRAEDRGGLHHTYVVIEFDDVNKLQLDDVSEYQTFSLRDEYEKLYFRSVITPPKRDIIEQGKFLLEKQKLKGHYYTLRVRMPARVTFTDGTVEDDGRTVRWMYPMERVADGEPIVMTATCPKPRTVAGVPVTTIIIALIAVAALAFVVGVAAIIINLIGKKKRK